jgi:hypothetical protein
MSHPQALSLQDEVELDSGFTTAADATGFFRDLKPEGDGEWLGKGRLSISKTRVFSYLDYGGLVDRTFYQQRRSGSRGNGFIYLASLAGSTVEFTATITGAIATPIRAMTINK